MFRRSVRITCLLIGLLATAGVAYRILQDEDVLGRERQRAAAAPGRDQPGCRTAARCACVAARVCRGRPGAAVLGQARPGDHRPTPAEPRRARRDVTPAGGSLAGSLDSLDQLAAAESRARTYVSRDELRLASDVIFTEVRDMLAAATADVQSVRDRFMRTERSPCRLDPAGTGDAGRRRAGGVDRHCAVAAADGAPARVKDPAAVALTS